MCVITAFCRSESSGCFDMKLISFVVIGGLTLVYVVAELGVAVWLGSLTLLSDGCSSLLLMLFCDQMEAVVLCCVCGQFLTA
jgi:hypothetical protein